MGRRSTAVRTVALCLVAFFLLVGARHRPIRPAERPDRIAPADPYSFSNASEIAVRHVSLDLSVDFETRIISGSATLDVENLTGANVLVLDTRSLVVRRILLDDDSEASYEFGEADSILGTPLRIQVRPDTTAVTIEYETVPAASGLHWMSPEQAQQLTPFLYSQNETIDARSWIPVQDSPSVRMTWDATIHVPPGYMALMSAVNPTSMNPGGVYTFKMGLPIPAYLQSLAVADIEFREIDSRSGVYAAPDRIDAAHAELEVVPEMMTEAEKICGPYLWGRYDVLIMPPSYHIGGMEHPRLTFATPSFISGDGSLVKLIAHELAHSWSGDQVTTATWDDPWLNEGLTVYLERRIMEAIFGDAYEDMLAENSLRVLEQFVARDPDSDDTRMHADFRGRSPNEGFTRIAYDKGGAFWMMLEAGVGRDELDVFLKTYFVRHAFDWMSADALVVLLRARLFEEDPGLENQLRINEWIFETGLPMNRPRVDSVRFNHVDSERTRFAGGTPASLLDTRGWSSHEYLYFLQFAQASTMSGRLGELDAAWGLSGTSNLTLLTSWSQWVAGLGYGPGFPSMERYLGAVGSGSGLQGVYTLLRNNGNASRATNLYSAHRPRYHPYTQASIDALLGFTGKRLESGPAMPPFKY